MERSVRKFLTSLLAAVLFAAMFMGNGGNAHGNRPKPQARHLPDEIIALVEAGDLGTALAAADILDRKPALGYGTIWPTSLVFRNYARLHGPDPVLDYLRNIRPGDGDPDRPDWLRLRAAHIFAVAGLTEEALAAIALIGDPSTKDEAVGLVGTEIAVDRDAGMGLAIIGAVQNPEGRLLNYLRIGGIGSRKPDGIRLAERAYALALSLARQTDSRILRDRGLSWLAADYMGFGRYELAKSLISEIGDQETRDNALYWSLRAGARQLPMEESIAMMNRIESPEVRDDAEITITLERLRRNMLDDVLAKVRLLETQREQNLELAIWMSEVVLMSKSRTEWGEAVRKLHVLGGEIADREIRMLAYGCGSELILKRGEIGWALLVAKLGNTPFDLRTALYRWKRRDPPHTCIELNNLYN